MWAIAIALFVHFLGKASSYIPPSDEVIVVLMEIKGFLHVRHAFVTCTLHVRRAYVTRTSKIKGRWGSEGDI